MSCAGTPVSWLRLEQLALGELGAGAAAAAREHLDACDACRAAFESIGADRRSLRPLRLEVARPPRRWLRWAAGGCALAAAAAVVLVAVGDRGREPPRLSRAVAIKHPHPALPQRGRDQRRVSIKGGELVVSLVRERDGRIERDPTHFAGGDRFKIAVTCSVPGAVVLEPVVTQGRERAHPLGPSIAIDCGNNTLLPGAFRITGDQPVRVCVSEHGAPRAACLELLPAL